IGQGRRDVAGLIVGECRRLNLNVLITDDRDGRFCVARDAVHGVRRDVLIKRCRRRHRELGSARELDRQGHAAQERGIDRDRDERDRDDEPQLALGDEGDGGLAGVEIVTEIVHRTHQASPSPFVVLVSREAIWFSWASLRSASVWRFAASPRDRFARPFPPVGARKCDRAVKTAPSAFGSRPDSLCPPPKNGVRTRSCMTGCVKTTKIRMSIRVVRPSVNAKPFTVASAMMYSTTAASTLIDFALKIVRLARAQPSSTAANGVFPSRSSSRMRSKYTMNESAVKPIVTIRPARPASE